MFFQRQDRQLRIVTFEQHLVQELGLVLLIGQVLRLFADLLEALKVK
jgi:hypothetical protein